ncbi:2056_t:CDS:2 [Diversispora eburnea]|uniref:2056_t:CDS:1 n=1 Tax=Diversispora eburnea TaxID=1213867 RepID=A0A9N8W179_9GLOM|nr:2056_t:CDS:2 [Diversispora eburnea]
MLSQEEIKDFEYLMNQLEKMSSTFKKSNPHDREKGKREERDEGGGKNCIQHVSNVSQKFSFKIEELTWWEKD